MPDEVTKKDFDEFRAEVKKAVKDSAKAILRLVYRTVKAYPQFKTPESGDEVSKSGTPKLAVVVRSNKPALTHWVEFRHENMDPVPMVTRVQLMFADKIGKADIDVPDPGTYLLICYIDGDTPPNPPVHKVDKIDVMVNI